MQGVDTKKTLSSLPLSENERQAVGVARRILRTKFPITQIILFGSKVRGDDDEESDVDLLLLTNRKIAWNERKAIIDALFDIELCYDVVLSPLIVPEQDWNKGTFSVMPIHEEVAREGVMA
jgi:predicted nucleotidyltransferase